MTDPNEVLKAIQAALPKLEQNLASDPTGLAEAVDLLNQETPLEYPAFLAVLYNLKQTPATLKALLANCLRSVHLGTYPQAQHDVQQYLELLGTVKNTLVRSLQSTTAKSPPVPTQAQATTLPPHPGEPRS